MAVGSTQPLTEMSNRNLPGGKGRPARKADNLTAICEPSRKNVGTSACYTDSFTFLSIHIRSGLKWQLWLSNIILMCYLILMRKEFRENFAKIKHNLRTNVYLILH
jgi:hypothetical protein